MDNYSDFEVTAILYTTSPNPTLLITSAMLYHKSTSEGFITPLNHPPGIHMYPIG